MNLEEYLAMLQKMAERDRMRHEEDKKPRKDNQSSQFLDGWQTHELT